MTEEANMKLWHCGGARSLRPLWTLEELGLPYELEILQFPPRLLEKDFLKLNALGTVPYFTDGDTSMTESVAICQYLVDRYPNDPGQYKVDCDGEKDPHDWAQDVPD